MPATNPKKPFSHAHKTFKILMHYNCITMVMQTIQVRLTKGQVNYLDTQVKTGMYSNRSDVIRDKLRRSWVDEIAGTLKPKKEFIGMDNVDAVKKIRRQSDKDILNGKIDLDYINSLKF